MFSFIHKSLPWIIIVMMLMLLTIMLFYTDTLSFPSNKVSDGIVAVISAVIGVLITIAVTAILLNQQTEAKVTIDRSMKQFEKKQEAYYTFVSHIERILTMMLERNFKGNETMSYDKSTSLVELIFQFGYLKMHMSNDSFHKIMQRTASILERYRRLSFSYKYQKEIVEGKKSHSQEINRKLYLLSTGTSEDLMVICQLLNESLYGAEAISKYDYGIIMKDFSDLCASCGINAHGAQETINDNQS